MSLNLPFGVKVLNPQAVDFYYGPWPSLAAAKIGVPLPVRFDGLTVQITGLGNYYWTAADLSDAGLIVKGAIPGGVDTNIQYNNAGVFGGSNTFTWNNATGFLNIGSGVFTFDVPNQRIVGGASSAPSGTQTFTFGDANVNKGTFGSAMFGELSEIDTGVGSGFNAGEANYIGAYGGHTAGRGVKVTGTYSWAGGWWSPGPAFAKTNLKAVQVSGPASFGFYEADLGQTDNHGVGARASAILGGLNHNIPAGSDRSVILGGALIKARAADPDQVYVPSLNINTVPINDNALIQLLVRDAVTGQIKYRTVASLPVTPPTAPAGANTQVQFNNAGAFGADPGLTYSAASDILTVSGASGTVSVNGGSAVLQVLQGGNTVSVQALGLTSSAAYSITTTGNLILSPSGNVGVGVGVPTAKLDINGSLGFNNNTGTAGQYLTSNGAGIPTWTNPAVSATPGGVSKSVQYNNAGSFGGATNFVFDFTTSRVGIGTTAPAKLFEIAAGADTVPMRISSTVASTAMNIEWWNDLAQLTHTFRIGFTGSTFVGGEQAFLTTAGAQPIVFTTNNIEAVRFDALGRVGIGTANPLAKLQLHNTGSNSVSVTLTATGADWNFGTDAQGNGTGGNQFYVFNNTDGAYRFSIQKGTGFVGIGTATPASKLDVNGAIAFGGAVGAVGQVLTSQAGGTNTWTTIVSAPPVNAVLFNSNSNLGAFAVASAGASFAGTTYFGDPNYIPVISFHPGFKSGNNGDTITFFIERSTDGGATYPTIIKQSTYLFIGATEPEYITITGADTTVSGSNRMYRLRWVAVSGTFEVTTSNDGLITSQRA